MVVNFSLIICLSSFLAACATPRFGQDLTMDGVSDRGLCQQLAVAKFESDDNIQNILMPKEDAKQEALAIRGEMKKRHPEWQWDLINSRKIAPGMSEEEAICSWGMPEHINRASYGDQWVYPRGRSGAQFLYFKNGTLHSFN